MSRETGVGVSVVVVAYITPIYLPRLAKRCLVLLRTISSVVIVIALGNEPLVSMYSLSFFLSFLLLLLLFIWSLAI